MNGETHHPTTTPGTGDAQTALLERILAGIEDVRAQLAGRVKPHYTVEEIAELTGRSTYTVRRWISEGRIAATRISGTGPKGRLLIARAELEKVIREGLGGAVPDSAFEPRHG